MASEGTFPFPLTVLFNPVNQGYGGNQKIGYFYAIKNGFDFVALRARRRPIRAGMPSGSAPAAEGRRGGCVFRLAHDGEGRRAARAGCRSTSSSATRILSWFENRMLRTSLTEFHSGYRLYSVAALKRVPFALNTNDFHFDTEIIIQFVLAGHAHRRAPDPDLLRRRDLPRERAEIRLGRGRSRC